MPQFFDRYINLVEEDNLIVALKQSLDDLDKLNLEIFKSIALKTYADKKWTTNEVFQHIIDNERVQSYRALRLARFDKTELPGFDQDIFAKHTLANTRTFEYLLEELKLVRQSSIHLFKNLNEASLLNIGVCSNVKINALALGFVIVGHQKHHLDIIEDRYFPLAS